MYVSPRAAGQWDQEDEEQAHSTETPLHVVRQELQHEEDEGLEDDAGDEEGMTEEDTTGGAGQGAVNSSRSIAPCVPGMKPCGGSSG